MNRLRFIIPTLIQINLIVAIFSVVFVIIIREQQAEMTTHAQQSFEQLSPAIPKIKDKIVNYQQRLQQNQQKINSYEQQLKGLKAELEEYKSQNSLLMQVKELKPERVTALDIPETAKTETLNASSSVYLKKPTSVKFVVKPTAHQPSVKPIRAIQIADNSFTPLNISKPNSEQANIPTIEKPEIEKNNIEVNSENENRLNDNNNNIVAIAENTDPEPQKFAPNPSEQETTEPITAPTVGDIQIEMKRDVSTSYANNVAYGLAIAADEGQINHGTKMYRKVQTAIRLLRQGETKEEATRKANVPTSVINQLMKWGEKRPGRLLNESQEK